MAAPRSVVEAVEAAIVASAHLAAYEHVAAAAQACERLGGLTTGRWRAAARELSSLEDDLEKAFAGAAERLTSRAEELGVPEDALWTVGDAAGTFDLLHDAALEEAGADERVVQVLEGKVIFGASFVEDPELPDRGTTLLFGWPEPLNPASWPWQANWIVGDSQDNSEDDAQSSELDLFETGELGNSDAIVAALAAELDWTSDQARTAVRDAAMALTRASLLAGAGEDEEDEDEDEDAIDDDDDGEA